MAARNLDQASDITFKEIFETIPISIWVEDFAEVVAALDALREQGVEDLGSYLNDHPGETERLVKMIRVIDINPASLSLYGAKCKEELFESVDLLFTPQALASFRKELVAVSEGCLSFTAEVESMKLGGERLDVLISVVPAIPGGGWGRVLVTATDITERKRAEAQVKRSEEQYKDLVEKAGIAIGVDRRDGTFSYLNDQFVEIFGYSTEELQRLSHTVLIHPDDYQRVSAIHAARVAGQSAPSRYEFRAVRADGSTVWLEVDSVPVVQDGEVVGTRSYMWDISDRKELEEELHASRASFASIVDQNADGIVVVDAGGVIRFANPASCTFLGVSVEELIGSQLDSVAFAGGARELRVRRPDGTPGIAEMGSVETSWNGKAARLVMLRDVTERKRLERELLHAQKMEAIGILAGGVAHEVNNLLQAMLSTAEARLSTGVGKAGADLLRELQSLIQRGRSQTRQLLLFSRREEPQLEVLDINRVLRENITLLERLIPANVRVELQPAAQSLWVRGDRGQLGQVLVNLVVNSTDALADGGVITIRSGRQPSGAASPTDPAARTAGRHVRPAGIWFEVKDSGTGIPEGVRERIFEPFFTTKERGFGTGLGLSVAHGIVSRHSGRIEVDSQLGRGTRVVVFLPEEPRPPSALAERRELSTGPVHGRGERVLLVEDEPGARTGLGEVLDVLGYDVLAVEDAEQALALDAESVFDLLITDLMLPGLSGAVLAEKLLIRWPNLKVIVISGYSEDRTADLALRLESARFLRKPFGMVELSREIRAVLDRCEPVPSAEAPPR